MEIRLLGPVELWSGEYAVVLDSNKERLILAQLALEANHPVAVDTLLAHGWEGVDPVGAAPRIHRPLSLLRRHLAQAAAGRDGPRLIRGSGVYTLEIAPDEVDLHRFRSLIRRGRELVGVGDDRAAHRVLREAAPLWRGDPLLGLNGSWPEGVRRSLKPLRRGADSARMGVVLRLHKYAEAADELSELVERHPDDEAFVAQLMLALAGTGRVLDATAVYQDARRRLAAEFGLTPGPVLRRVHAGLLAGESADRLVAATQGGRGTVPGADGADRVRASSSRPTGTGMRPSSSQRDHARQSGNRNSTSRNPSNVRGASGRTESGAPTAAGPAATTKSTIPVLRQPYGTKTASQPLDSLPRQGPLVGRHSELATLVARATAAATDREANPVTLVCVSGMPGVGKSAFSVGAARRLADHFSDGVVFLRLNAHAEGGPISVDAALSRLLALIGFSENDMPYDIAARGALWRARLAELSCLLVLDDASDPDQVRPLLPGDSSPSFTIVTSRRQLTGLPAASHITLDVLQVAEAVALFRLFAGAERTTDQKEVEEIVSLSGRIALGVELLASRFATRPAWSLGDLTERLTRLPGRLGEIRDMHNELARAFELSYLALTGEQRRAFRLLGLHPGHEFTVQDTQALLGSTQQEAERALEALFTCHLIKEPQPDRYLTHELLHEYAVTLTYQEDSADERRAAVTRLVTYYMGAADRAVHIVLPNRVRTRFALDDEAVRSPEWGSTREAHAWLTLERRNLIAAERIARDTGQTETAARLGQLVAVYLDSESQWWEAEELHLRSIAHWTRVGDGKALRQALIMLAENRRDSSKYAAALEACEQALYMARIEGDTDTEAAAFGVAGVVRLRMGHILQSIDHQQHALALRSHVGTAFERARCHNNLAMALLEHAEFAAAESHFEEAHHWFRTAGDTRAETSALNNVANLHGRRGSLATARTLFEAALARAEADGNLYQLATTRSNLADILSRSGEFDRALSLHHDAIRDFSAVYNRFGLANALNNLAQTRSRSGQYDEAVRLHRRALHIAQEINAGPEIAEALRGLGRAELGRRDVDTAERYLHAALAQSSDAPRGIALSRAVLADILVARGKVSEAIQQLVDAVCLMRDVDPYERERMGERLAELQDDAQSKGE